MLHSVLASLRVRAYAPNFFAREAEIRGTLDIVSIFLILIGLTVFGLTSIGYAFGGRPIGVVGAILSILGLLFWMLFNLLLKPYRQGRQPNPVDPMFTVMEIVVSFLAVVVSTLAIFFVNVSASEFFPEQSSASNEPISKSSVSQFMAIAEEVFFRLGLQVNLMYFATAGVGIFMTAVFGMLFHVYRYGGNPLFLTIVFFSWIILGSAFYFAKGRLTVTLLSHMFVNFIASPPEGFQGASFSPLSVLPLLVIGVMVVHGRWRSHGLQ